MFKAHNGYILTNKPAGISSFGVVACVRRVLSQLEGKKVKVGHTGTLDPFATGLMIIVVGNYTKKAAEFSKLDKVYEATVRLGFTSSTGDPEGEITPVAVEKPTKQAVETALTTFVGTIQQTPPIFSAIKVNGQRAYKLARAGQEVEMPKRTVEIFSLELMDYNFPDIRVRAHVSSGTYIRTLAADIGQALGTQAYCAELRRTKVGKWRIEDAIEIEPTDNQTIVQGIRE